MGLDALKIAVLFKPSTRSVHNEMAVFDADLIQGTGPYTALSLYKNSFRIYIITPKKLIALFEREGVFTQPKLKLSPITLEVDFFEPNGQGAELFEGITQCQLRVLLFGGVAGSHSKTNLIPLIGVSDTSSQPVSKPRSVLSIATIRFSGVPVLFYPESKITRPFDFRWYRVILSQNATGNQ